MAVALPSRVPLTSAPVFARDVKELETVISAQDAEEKALKQRLVDSTREVEFLKRRLRDSNDELEVTAEATLNAAERLEAHQGRQGLLLAAEAERVSAERAALEDELRRMEQLLYARDQEITKLRKAHESLQADCLEGELKLTGMAVANEKANQEVLAFGAGVQELRDRLSSAQGMNRGGPSANEAVSMENIVNELNAKQEEQGVLRAQADMVTKEAQRLEAELAGMKEHVQLFERDLRQKQEQIENYEHRLVREAAAMKAKCDELRHNLHEEQKDAAGIEQRAVLQERCGAEAEGVRREVVTILQTVRGLASTLRARGLIVCSPQVNNDPVDVAMHVFLRSCGYSGPGLAGAPPIGTAMMGPPGAPILPPVVWRLAPEEYLIDEDRVRVFVSQGHLVVQDPRSGQTAGIQQFMSSEASRVKMDFAGAHGAVGMAR